MRNTVFDYIGNLDTIFAVFIGAFLATIGALFAEIIQDKRHRKRRECDAAKFFGDILSSFDRVLDFAFRSQDIGDKWGNTTLRLFKTAQREAQVYERNRERLFDIRDMALRARIHTHFLTETFPLETIIENCTKLHDVQSRLNNGKKRSAIEKQSLEAEISQIHGWLESALRLIKSRRKNTPIICNEIEKIAKVKFVHFDNQSNGASNTSPKP